MKRIHRWKQSLTAKIVAIFLLTVFLFVGIASGAGVLYLLINGAYSDGGEGTMQSLIDSLAWADMSQLGDVYLSALQAEDKEAQEQAFQRSYGPQNCNFFFTVTDDRGVELLKNYTEADNRGAYSLDDTVVLLEETRTVSRHCATEEDLLKYRLELERLYEVTKFNSLSVNGGYTVEAQYVVRETKEIHIQGYVRSVFTAKDKYYRVTFLLETLLPMRTLLAAICIIFLGLGLVVFLFLLTAAGYSAGHTGIHLTWFDRIPLDLLILLLAGLGVGLFRLLHSTRQNLEIYALTLLLCLPAQALLLVAILLSFVARLRAGKWWKNTLGQYVLQGICRVWRFVAHGTRYAAENMPLYWRGGLIWGLLTAVELTVILACGRWYELTLTLFAVEKLLLTPLLIAVLVNLRQIQRSGEGIAAGNMNKRIDLRYMLPVFRQHAQRLNGISEGLQSAIEKSTRSERMRAELIANVSHDIKTPLTSIINYVDLLKKQGLNAQNAPSYLEVLDRQSARLKKLTEDLIEATKASTGNIPVNAEQTDVNVLLSQAAGEYEARLQARGLELIAGFSPEQPCVYADGRLLWRVFDNLLSNICKYAQPGTRVYLNSVTTQQRVLITFRNISEHPLNITSQELMERFVRGDGSRNTEGSGLGLSIARSLVELQGGEFSLVIDGDLFKAVIDFPVFSL